MQIQTEPKFGRVSGEQNIGSINPACYHRRTCLPCSCSVGLEQSPTVSSGIAITASFPQQTGPTF